MCKLRWFPPLTILLLFAAACSQQGVLRPSEPTAVSNEVVAGQPQLVTFTELEADPTVYQDKVIRVTGTYVALPVVACSPRSGPHTSSALIANDLRLDILGFEAQLGQLVPQELTLTVDGILRRYNGPLGCGKRPDAGILWYLEALQIVQPNPLVQGGTIASGNTSIIPPPFPSGTPVGPDVELTPEGEPTIGIGGPPTPTPSPTTTTATTASSTPTIQAGESVTPISTGAVGTPTRTPTRTLTPLPSSTSGPGGSTATPTPSQTPTANATSGPLPTATSGGYPSPPTSTPYP